VSYLIFILPAILLSMYAQFKVKSTFSRYSQVRSSRGYTGANVAEILLRRKGISGRVAVEPIAGSLTDHYDPINYKLRLSEDVYGSSSIAALGVAAHECGHAIQHSERYSPLEFRHRLFPITNFASSASFPILMIGFLMNNLNLVLLGIALFSAVVLFHIVTLPVELNASRRAVALLSEAGLVAYDEIPMVKSVLSAAALTYLAATISAIANLLYYLSIFAGRDEN